MCVCVCVWATARALTTGLLRNRDPAQHHQCNMPPVYQSSRLPSLCLHPPSLHHDLFSPRSFTTLPTNHHSTPEAKLATDNSNFLKDAFFGATAYAADLISTYSIGHYATEDALCVCVCVCLSLSLSLPLARASELSSSHKALRLCAREGKRAKRFRFVRCKDLFCFCADRGS